MLDSLNEQTPSPEPASVPAGELELSPPPSAETEPSDGQHWWSRFLQTRGHRETVEDLPPTDAGEAPASIAPKTVTLTEEELQQRISRQAQSLHDRETARRNREAAEAERRRLRDEDPFSYAQQEREREDTAELRQQQTLQLMGLLGQVGRQHDAVSVDPIVNVLPQKERERILALPNAGQGLPGRKVIVDEALKTYGRLEYERGYREAQTKLRKDPAFRKSVLSEFRGGFDEAELYPGDGGTTPSSSDEDNVSNRLRGAFFQRG